MSERIREVSVVRSRGARTARAADAVAAEDPLEIRLGDAPLAVVMRTPGDDEDLVRGFCLTEGVLLAPSEIAALERSDGSRICVRLSDGVQVDAARFQRNLFVSSSCGVCGKASIEAVRFLARSAPGFTVRRDVIAGLTTELRRAQPTFDRTGGLHAAGLYEPNGHALAVREDVGRHNAVDKAIGAVAAVAWPLPPAILVVSGRQSFEVLQKAAVTGIGAVVGISAPSSLAVELAREHKMLLVGFARGDEFNVYAGEERVVG